MPNFFGNNYNNIGTTENPIYRSSSGGSGSSSGIRVSYTDSYSGRDSTGNTREIYNMATSGSNDGINNSAILDIAIFVDHIDSFYYRDSMHCYVRLAIRNFTQAAISNSGYTGVLEGWSKKKTTGAELNQLSKLRSNSTFDLANDTSQLEVNLLITTSTDGLITFNTSNPKSYPMDYYIDCRITI